MLLKELKPRKALNKAYLKVKPNRTEIESFKTNLISLLDRTNETESEEFHKNLLTDFFKKTYYDPNHFINTKGRNDLVIHNGNSAKSSVGVIIEAKKPTNKSEMITTSKLNSKAFQELVLYYLRERITQKNLEIKHLVATNINEWFIFNEQLFERLFAQNKAFVRQFENFEASKKTTDVFYKEIAEPFIDSITSEIEFTYFNLHDYLKPLRNTDKADDNSLIALFKLLSPEHLLKLPFTNDSNSLDKRFYSELLHIIGLTETKEGSKKLIGRNKEGERNTGSILEDAIIQLDSLDKLNRLEKPNQYGNTTQERLFNVALELSITWINRILFLKLLEAQLITYHKGDKSYSFLNLDQIKNYDDLNSLFFQVLARKYNERNEDVKKAFEKVPYLNSSLFEPTDIEQVTLFISNLKDDKTIPIISSTVLKDKQGKKRTGNLSTLEYLFEFLNAYDFSSEGSEEIQEENKTLINASVLGLIFEKINGYKDGSFFTPGFITMYMCRETIRKAVIQKFNDALLGSAVGVSKRRAIIPYNPKLKELARELRNNSTKSEIILWKELKGRFEGKYDFHRQKPLDNYIADFFCHELKLVIEIDGETHNWEETQQKDFKKECRLNELGLNVLRFPDTEIFHNLNGTVNTIKQYVDGFEKRDLSAFKYEETPLNPLSRYDFVLPNSNMSEDREMFKTLDDVYEQIGEDRLFTRQQANDIVNSLKICDPAVGSGHFLVSALNEIIAVKNDLKILQDRNGKRLKEYQVEVVNDELIVTDEEGELFEYTPYTPLAPLERGNTSSKADTPPAPLKRGVRNASESQRIQETLFHEKQTIIENCLFGVDVNSNSVKICRLRLWIELLKNAYYVHTPHEGKHTPGPSQEGSKNSVPSNEGSKNSVPSNEGSNISFKDVSYRELQTLPNIDINIKCGNSLVSRFAIDADLKQALKKSKWTIDSYRIAVATYRNAENKEQKREMERLITDIKSDFRSEISQNDPKVKKLHKLSGDLFQMTQQGQLFEMSKKELADWNKKVLQITDEIKNLETEIEEIKANKIFENAFEWRFEFPEVLNDDGDFVGFDVVIGNPPYVQLQNLKIESNYYSKVGYQTFNKSADLYCLFYEKGMQLAKLNGLLSFITSNKFIKSNYGFNTRVFIKKYQIISIIDFGELPVFENASTFPMIFTIEKNEGTKESIYSSIPNLAFINFNEIIYLNSINFNAKNLVDSNWMFQEKKSKLIDKLSIDSIPLIDYTNGEILFGIKTGFNRAYVINKNEREKLINADHRLNEFIRPFLNGEDVRKYKINWDESFIILLKSGFQIENYPVLHTRMNLFKDKLSNRSDQGKNWWDLRTCAYYDLFDKPKILYPDIALESRFAIDTNGFIPNATLFCIPMEDYYLLGLLNSKLIWYYLSSICPVLGDINKRGRLRLKTIYLKNVPIRINKFFNSQIELLSKQVNEAKQQNPKADTSVLENQIDQLVYQLYDLTEDEIKIIETSLKH
jgi:very-short-patch-repair endonuclease